MSKKMRSIIFLSVASLVVSFVILAGVIFAWIATNHDVRGGISVSVLKPDESGVYIEKFNNGSVPEDGYRMYPEDIIKLGLRTTDALSALAVRLTSPKINADSFISNFADRNDLLIGNYQSAVSVAGSVESETKKFDFDIDAFLEKNVSDESLWPLYKMAFLYEFTANNELLGTMAVKLTGIGSGAGAEDYSLSPLELSMSGSGTERFYRFIGTDVPAGHPIRSSNYFGVEGDKISAMGFPIDIPLSITVEFGRGHNGDAPSVPGMKLAANKDYSLKSAIEREYAVTLNKVFDNSDYYALNYNCFDFQQMTIGFAGTKV